MSFVVHSVNTWFAVAGQLCAADMSAVANTGYKSVIINRPDFEAGSGQPVSDDVMQAAIAAGLQVEYQPVVSGRLTYADAVHFGQLLKQLPKPILAYCQSGGRCYQLFTAATAIQS